MEQRISLAMGPVLFNWPSAKWQAFYAKVADEAPVDIVYLGEVVCSKRLPFYAEAITQATERLRRGGKRVVLSSQALITLARERRDTADLVCLDEFEIEVNDLTALLHMESGRHFHVGPFVNIYNESTLNYIVNCGATSICLPPELPIETVRVLSKVSRQLGVGCEVWSFGRIPLAISGRCYHARLEGLSKDTCQFVCGYDENGRDVSTLDRKKFLAINGVQTLSHAYCNIIGDTEHLVSAGVSSLRLSPHTCDMSAIAKTFRDRLDGKLDSQEAQGRIEKITGPVAFSNGFLFGEHGSQFTHGSSVTL